MKPATSPYIGSSRPYRDGPLQARLAVRRKCDHFGERGSGWSLIFQDSLGRWVVWHTARDPKLEVGDSVTAEFVVKSHWERDGVPENLTSRFRILERH